MSRKTSYLVATAGVKYGCLCQAFGRDAAEAERYVEAMHIDHFSEVPDLCRAIDSLAPVGLWFTGGPDYIRSVVKGLQ